MVVAHHDAGARLGVGEVDEHVDALTRADPQVRCPLRRVEEAVVGADHDEVGAVAQREVVGGQVRGVEDPEAVEAAGHLEPGPHGAVDGVRVADHPSLPTSLGHEAEGAEASPAIRVETPVLEGQRRLELAGGQPQRVRRGARVHLVAHRVQAEQPRVRVQACDAVRVVVEPERGRLLSVRPLVAEVAAGRHGVHRVPVVLGGDDAAVEVQRHPGPIPVAGEGAGDRGVDVCSEGMAAQAVLHRGAHALAGMGLPPRAAERSAPEPDRRVGWPRRVEPVGAVGGREHRTRRLRGRHGEWVHEGLQARRGEDGGAPGEHAPSSEGADALHGRADHLAS